MTLKAFFLERGLNVKERRNGLLILQEKYLIAVHDRRWRVLGRKSKWYGFKSVNDLIRQILKNDRGRTPELTRLEAEQKADDRNRLRPSSIPRRRGRRSPNQSNNNNNQRAQRAKLDDLARRAQAQALAQPQSWLPVLRKRDRSATP